MKLQLIYLRLRHLYYRLLAYYYLLSGRQSKSRGYFEYKWLAIEKAIGDPDILELFQSRKMLPAHFGERLDERIIEYPWLLAQLPEKRGSLLDAGSTLNFYDILTHSKLANKKITIVGLAPEHKSFPQLGVKYVSADIRKLPFKNHSFDIVTCISTLEHIGMDNSEYTEDPRFHQHRPEDFILALKELKRVLKNGGYLFLTFPYGRKFQTSSFQVFTQIMTQSLIRKFKPKLVKTDYFQYAQTGWQRSTVVKCQSGRYFRLDSTWSINQPVAAEVVACIILVKH